MPGAFGTTLCFSLRSRVPDAPLGAHETCVHRPLSRGDGLMKSTKAPFWCFRKRRPHHVSLILMHANLLVVLPRSRVQDRHSPVGHGRSRLLASAGCNLRRNAGSVRHDFLRLAPVRVPDACTVKRSGHETYVHLPLSQGDRHLPPVHSLSAAYPQDR